MELSEFNISDNQKKALLSIAHNAIFDHAAGNRSNFPLPDGVPEVFRRHYGAFVSIYLTGKLKGCIGNIETEKPLCQTIYEMAIAAAFRDKRFEPVPKNKYHDIQIEISILSPLHKIASIDEIIPGKHGVLIRKGLRSGTYLPQVAKKTGWDTEQLLAHCSNDKANLGNEGWKEADIYTYEAMIFSELKEQKK